MQVTEQQAQEAASTEELIELFTTDALARYEDKERAVTPVGHA